MHEKGSIKPETILLMSCAICTSFWLKLGKVNIIFLNDVQKFYSGTFCLVIQQLFNFETYQHENAQSICDYFLQAQTLET